MTDHPHVIDVSRAVDPLEEEPDERRVTDWLTQSLYLLDQPASEVSIRIVGKAEMAELNKQYRQKSAPTNVLSFPADLDADGTVFLGDIVVCSEVVQDESSEFGQRFPDRYAHMMIHGLLHLMGHDHIEEQERIEMESLEQRLLAEFDISNPYLVADAS